MPFRRVAPHEILNVVRVASLADYRKLTALLPGWVFRGQRSAQWFLEPSAERLARRTGGQWLDIESRALSLLRGYDGSDLLTKPDSDDHLGWLALLQHYGGPTRLLDFTHSADVAAFFALEDLPVETAAVWAVNELILTAFLQDQLRTPLPSNCDLRRYPDRWWFVNRCHDARFAGFAAVVAHPAREERRLRAQLGTFLLSLNTDHTLIQNLFGMFDLHPAAMEQHAGRGYWTDPFAEHVVSKLQRSPVVKIELAGAEPESVVSELDRVGVNRAVLFPGIDGFARSLNHRALTAG